VPFIAQAKGMRWVALKRSVDLKNGRKLDNYMERFGIDRKLAGLVYSISRDEGMDPELIFNICWVESQFNPDAVGSVGEIGLMQVRPETAATIDPGVTTEKLHDPAYNIRIGIKHLKDQLHFYRGDIRLALLAYNRGRNTINTLLLLGLNPANGYAAKVLDSNM
jgi:soluble lytic murein transglycosylase-like protein